MASLSVCAILIASGGSRLVAQGGPCQPDTARFLEQATFGPTPDLCAHVQDLEAFLTEQFNLPPSSYPDFVADFAPYYTDPNGDPVQYGCDQGPGQPRYCPQNAPSGGFCRRSGGPDPDRNTCLRLNYSLWPIQEWFFQRAANGDLMSDQLRQRVAFALSQIWVISGNEGNLNRPQRFGPFVQILDQDTFGNWRDLMEHITLNPGMGRYLDMTGSRADNPNENYAREILQLFNVGVDKLNPGGTPILDGDGNRLPTYDQVTVTNFARAFTGWVRQPDPLPQTNDYWDPLVPDSNTSRHDQNPKPLLNCDPDGNPVDDYYPCTVLPGGRPAQVDLEDTLDNIFNYPSVAPFIAKNLIQHLVTSNPSPDYVARVANAFNTGTYQGPTLTFGSGQRGDMQAVIAAILLDDEARSPTPNVDFGHLKEPVLWIANLLRAFNQTSDNTDFVLGERYIPSNIRMDQDLYYSPTVFNYFPPDNTIPIPDTDLFVFAPEFGIQSTSTSLARINFAYQVIFPPGIPTNGDRPVGTLFGLSALQPLAGDPAELVGYLNDLMLHGSMTSGMADIVTNAVAAIPEDDLAGRVKEAVYLIATSSQYIVER